VIAGKKVEIGQNVAPGVPVVDLVSMQQVKIKVSVPEGDIADIQVGDEALVCIPAAENLCLEGRVMEKGIVANPLSRSYEVKIAVENRKHVLLPGMVTDVCVMSNREKSAILLPSHIVQIDEQNQTFVWVNQNGRASKRIITCGEYTSGGVVVESGIGSGDEIIISGQHKVCEGSAVSL
jgi:membrane fusion protein (multidrug efflux system)